MIRKEDGAEFGVEWYQSTFDALVSKMNFALERMYKGPTFAPVAMAWKPDNFGRRWMLAPDEAAIDYLAKKWRLTQGNQRTCDEFADLVAK